MKTDFNNSPELTNTVWNAPIIDTARAVLALLEIEYSGMYFTAQVGNIKHDNHYSFKDVYAYLRNLVDIDQEAKQKSNISDEEFKKLFKAANERNFENKDYGDPTFPIMLQVVHTFKHAMDDSKEWAENNQSGVQPYKLTHLLLSILYEICGSTAKLNRLDPLWEEVFEEILSLPNYSDELDRKITDFLLRPIYCESNAQLSF